MSLDRANLFELSPDPVCVLDGEGRLLDANAACLALLAAPLERLRGSHWQDWVAATPGLLAGETPEDRELVLRTIAHDGQVYWLRWRFVRDPASGRIAAFINDLTRVQQDAALVLAQRDRMRIASTAASIGIWEWQPQSGQLEWDAVMCELHGVPPHQFSGRLEGWEARVLLDDLATFLALFAPEGPASRELQADFRVVLPDGGMRWLRLRGEGWRSVDGRSGRYIGACWDVTQLMTSLDQLRLGEAKLRSLFDLSPVGFALNRFSDGRFLDGNQALVRTSGYALEELRQLNMADLVPPEHHGDQVLVAQALRAGGYAPPIETEFLRKDGSRCPVQVQSVLFKDHRGIDLFWSVIEDTSERERVERMKAEFVSIVSHELRTPLTSISGALALLTSGRLDEASEQTAELLELARRNTQRLTMLVDDLLDMEKIAAGELAFACSRQPLWPLVELAVHDQGASARQRAVTLQLSGYAAECPVVIDAGRLQQALGNLISNAIKFSPEGGTVEVRVTLDGDAVRIEVEDHGEGVPETFRDRLFVKFSQADASDTRCRGGTGLGLAIARELVERMQGEIGCQSEPGQGAIFWIRLPLARTTCPLA